MQPPVFGGVMRVLTIHVGIRVMEGLVTYDVVERKVRIKRGICGRGCDPSRVPNETISESYLSMSKCSK